MANVNNSIHDASNIQDASDLNYVKDVHEGQNDKDLDNVPEDVMIRMLRQLSVQEQSRDQAPHKSINKNKELYIINKQDVDDNKDDVMHKTRARKTGNRMMARPEVTYIHTDDNDDDGDLPDCVQISENKDVDTNQRLKVSLRTYDRNSNNESCVNGPGNAQHDGSSNIKYYGNSNTRYNGPSNAEHDGSSNTRCNVSSRTMYHGSSNTRSDGSSNTRNNGPHNTRHCAAAANAANSTHRMYYVILIPQASIDRCPEAKGAAPTPEESVMAPFVEGGGTHGPPPIPTQNLPPPIIIQTGDTTPLFNFVGPFQTSRVPLL